jgi:uncharacterized NAD(P)/FAD-binding protein YdhS
MSKEEIARYRARAEQERRRARGLVHPNHRRLGLDLADGFDAVADAYERLTGTTAQS